MEAVPLGEFLLTQFDFNVAVTVRIVSDQARDGQASGDGGSIAGTARAQRSASVRQCCRGRDVFVARLAAGSEDLGHERGGTHRVGPLMDRPELS